jgi:uncharacterized protein
MKFIPDATQGPTITGYGPGWIEVNREKHHSSLIVSSQGICRPWHCPGYDELSDTYFAELADLAPELILFGSGERIRFPQPRWLASLYQLRIGVETMDTQAACRTYNFLSGEGRKVVAALLI